jgi:diaminopimelate decarboxylase
MASNYNKFSRPAMVLVNNRTADIIVKRESYADIINNEVLPERLINK